MSKITTIVTLIVFLVLFASNNTTSAQGVTSAGMTGLITDDMDEPLPDATIQAVHTPSGTSYLMVTQTHGRFTIRKIGILQG